ncbi:hypothetical protein A2U01_0063472, partial [Trifolium medium]|nr:hypothetical protein [Trifolium medium]
MLDWTQVDRERGYATDDEVELEPKAELKEV